VFSFIPSGVVVLFVVCLRHQKHSDMAECYPLSGLYGVLVWWSWYFRYHLRDSFSSVAGFGIRECAASQSGLA
jgi:hypothetical protein